MINSNKYYSDVRADVLSSLVMQTNPSAPKHQPSKRSAVIEVVTVLDDLTGNTCLLISFLMSVDVGNVYWFTFWKKKTTYWYLLWIFLLSPKVIYLFMEIGEDHTIVIYALINKPFLSTEGECTYFSPWLQITVAMTVNRLSEIE